MDLFFRGLLIGISIAAPVGPIGVICIRHSLLNGWRTGLSAGLGAACADGVYAIAAILGLAVLTKFFAAAALPLHIGGGLLLLYIAFKVFKSSAAEGDFRQPDLRSSELHHSGFKQSELAVVKPSAFGALLQTFFLTITNPMTILSFSAILSAFGVERLSMEALYVVSGVFVGSAVWWLFLSAGVSRFSGMLTPRGMTAINYASSAVIAGFGLWSMLSLRL